MAESSPDRVGSRFQLETELARDLGLVAATTIIVGGIIVGVVENLAAGYLDPMVGGGTKDFTP